MEKIDLKYKIPLQGKYHKGINYCPFCDHEPNNIHSEIIGFADSNIGTMVIIECPNCFEKWKFHARKNMHYDIFIFMIEDKMQKHFK